MNKFRMRFSKIGRAVYISHLDLMHTMQRAFSRAGFELCYSEGFNPHPALSVALPLSVGITSFCELLDFKLKTDLQISLDELKDRLNKALPEGIVISEIYYPERKIKELKYLEVNCEFEYDGEKIPDIQDFFSADSIILSKRTKKGFADFDLKPHIKAISFNTEKSVVSINAVISAQEPTVNPDLLAEALRQLRPELAPQFSRFTRIEIYDADMRAFK